MICGNEPPEDGIVDDEEVTVEIVTWDVEVMERDLESIANDELREESNERLFSVKELFANGGMSIIICTRQWKERKKSTSRHDQLSLPIDKR